MEIKLKVRDIMTKDVVTLDTRMSIFDAMEKMSKYNIGSLIITDVGKPVGVLTESDIIRKLGRERASPTSVSVSDIMSFPIITADPELGIVDAIRRMRVRNQKNAHTAQNPEKSAYERCD